MSSNVPNSPAIEFQVNGRTRSVAVPPMARLLDVLRESLGLTGTKEGCGEGECGACSVLIDGKLGNSCLVPAIQVAGRSVTTIEAVATMAPAGPIVQQEFINCGGAQCGICTPGMIVASVAILQRHPQPTTAEIQAGLAGNLCRCTGYTKIIAAVSSAAERLRSARKGEPENAR
jgi:aerobic carbon-monoxide dehydrogenase small subunit